MKQNCKWIVHGTDGFESQTLHAHAPLPPAGVWASPADARDWPFKLRGVEAEVALRLRGPVDADLARSLDLATARTLVDAMCVSIEIVDSRWVEGLQAPTWAKLADLQLHGALVLGAWVPFEPARDWSAQVCRVRLGEQPPREFRGTHSMADPAFVLMAWLRHATRQGAPVAAGTVVTTGTWCGILQARAGEQVGVPASLLAAVAKQESRFSVGVRSVVGAVGLLQLMPDTAVELAGRPLSPAELQDPARNATLGARYLRQLLRSWDGNPWLAVASYNAGPGAVAGWVDGRLSRQPELWVEAIPYPETRLYVKKVLGNLWSLQAPRRPRC